MHTIDEQVLHRNSLLRAGLLRPQSLALLASFAVGGCIAPPPKSAETAGEAEGSDAPLSVAEQIDKKLEDSGLVAVPPNDALIWDGANISLINIDPGGSWYAFADTTAGGEMVPPSTGEFEDYIIDGAIHTEGKGYREWGGGIGMNFVGSPMLTPLDASKYKGITFKAWGEGWVHVGLGSVPTMPEFEICNMDAKKCYDHHATDIKLTSEPKVYEFTWEKLRQAGWGSPQTELDPSTVVALTFTSRGASNWNFYIDDVGFIK